MRRFKLSFQSPCLPVHIFNNDIVYLAEGAAVLKNLPRLVGVVVYLGHIVVAYHKQTVANEIGYKIVIDIVLVKFFSAGCRICTRSFYFLHFIDISNAVTLWVSAPKLIMSIPVLATSAIFSRVIFPLASSLAR